MQYWKPLEPKRRSGTSANRIEPEQNEGEILVVQEGWTQSRRFTGPDKHDGSSSNGRQFREFRFPDEPPSWLGNENRQDGVSYSSSSDEEGELVINKVPLPRSTAPQASLQVDENGWYDWDVDPSATLQDDSKRPVPDSAYAITRETSQSTQENLPESESINLVDPTNFENRPATVDISFLEDFDNSLGAIDDLESSLTLSQIVLATPPTPRVSLTRSVSPVTPIHHPPTLLRGGSDPEGPNPATGDSSDGSEDATNDIHLEVTTREELTDVDLDTGNDPRAAMLIPIRLGFAGSKFTLPNEEDSSSLKATHLNSGLAGNALNPDYQDGSFASEDDVNQGIPEPIATIEHSREQSQRLRLYSTLYADFARDPWKWHERRDLVREMFPSLEPQSSFSDPPPTYGEVEGQAHHARQAQQASIGSDAGEPTQNQHRRRPDQLYEEARRATSFIDPPATTPWSHQTSDDYIPLDGQQYCTRCRRHFKTTWRMQKHLSDSRIHPYYCQVCTIDYSSFKQLYMHYAERPKCRPPELEFGPAKPFLQILAEYQSAGRIEAARNKSAVDAEQAINSQSGAKRLLEADTKLIPSRPTLNQAAEAPACPICMVPLMRAKEILATACGHVYCSSCILHYFSKERPNCPKCRTPVSKATLIPLELC